MAARSIRRASPNPNSSPPSHEPPAPPDGPGRADKHRFGARAVIPRAWRRRDALPDAPQWPRQRRRSHLAHSRRGGAAGAGAAFRFDHLDVDVSPSGAAALAPDGRGCPSDPGGGDPVGRRSVGQSPEPPCQPVSASDVRLSRSSSRTSSSAIRRASRASTAATLRSISSVLGRRRWRRVGRTSGLLPLHDGREPPPACGMERKRRYHHPISRVYISISQ
jgi:hypothetical protein